MSSIAAARAYRAGLAGELAKLPAFMRRDFLVAWSYRVAFFSDIVGLAAQMLLFAFVGRLIDSDQLPSFGGHATSYIEFVAIGISVNLFVQVALTRTAGAMRTEQMIGTLESLLMTPTALPTIQLGSAVFDLVYVPIRTGVFLGFLALVVGIDLQLSGVLPAAAILLAFIPFVWGLGILAAAAVLTFRRGGGVLGIGALILGFLSGAFFPLDLFPGWIEAIASLNPLAIAIDGMRHTILGGDGWAGVGHDVLLLVPMSALSLLAGSAAFRLALRRERRRGTLGLY